MDLQRQPVLEMRGISRSFPGVRALHEANLRLHAGEIHSLMGQNGAGKSTLIKVLTGVHAPDSGEMHLHGQCIQPVSPLAAQRLGIATVYQEVNLCPNLSVAENIFIGRFPVSRGKIDWAELNREARDELGRLGLEIDVTASLDSFPVAIQQMVAIARAVSMDSRVLILDEPTSSLDDDEVEQLFSIMRGLKGRGVAILFVTHFLDQVYAISDRITVMRNGECEGEYLPAELDRMALISKMIGRAYVAPSEAAAAEEKRAENARDSLMSVCGFGRRGLMQPLDLDLRRGEVLGLGGLLGSGRTETARLLFGADKADSGDIEFKDGIHNNTRPFSSPREAIRAGLGYCPEDRKTDGIIAELSVRENIVLALQARRGWLRGIPLKQQRTIADRYISLLGISTPDAEKPIGKLSGGNQQKAMLARWLATDPSILILDEPTRGIDVAAKQEIMEQVLALCRKGLSILFISSDLDETVRVSHRVAVLRDRNKVGELAGSEVDEGSIMQVIAGSEI
ncbi:MAG TPA: sugar ABC transporter ATP-binding protein [Rhodocyclaceae bacterium]|nr:sugar ABC transporter ATP-binding protein [Rhodocyclaceae bacterium]